MTIGFQTAFTPCPSPGTDRGWSGEGESAAAGQRRPLEFLFQGGFGPGRGIEELIHAWQAIDPNDAVLLLRGNGHAHKTICVGLAKSLGLNDVSVFFPPPVRENRLIAAAATADIGVIPYMPNHSQFPLLLSKQALAVYASGLADHGWQYGLCQPDPCGNPVPGLSCDLVNPK